MSPALSVAALITIAAVTPGPNNFIVLAAAMNGGPARAAIAAASVICGSLALLALVHVGLGTLFEAAPGFVRVLTLASAGYIAWLAVAMIARAGNVDTADGLPARPFGIALFQIANPKAWTLVIAAVTATIRADGSAGVLAFTLVAVTAACLGLWASFGIAFSVLLRARHARAWLDRILGTLLFLTAAALGAPAVFP